MVCQYDRHSKPNRMMIGSSSQPSTVGAAAPRGINSISAASGPYATDASASSPIAGTPSSAPILRACDSRLASRRPSSRASGFTSAGLEGDAALALQPEVTRDAGADVAETRASAKPPARDVRTERQHRHAFARVVAARPRRIAAVVAGDHHQIVLQQFVLELGQSFVEGFQRRGVTGEVAAVAVQAVEVDEVREQQAAIAQRARAVQHFIEHAVVAAALAFAAGGIVAEQVADLADRNDI